MQIKQSQQTCGKFTTKANKMVWDCTSNQVPKPTALIENKNAKLSKSCSCSSLNQESTPALRR